MDHDHGERRQPSTWWVGRGRTRPRRWWADGAFTTYLAAYLTLGVLYEPSVEGWCIVGGVGASAVVVLINGYARDHELASWLLRALPVVTIVYVVTAGLAVVALDLGVRSAIFLATPLVCAAVCVGGAWRRRA